MGEGFCPLVVALEERGAGQSEVSDGLGAPVLQRLGGGQEPLDVDLGLCAVVSGQRYGYQDLLGVAGGVADLGLMLIVGGSPLFCLIEIAGGQGGDA